MATTFLPAFLLATCAAYGESTRFMRNVQIVSDRTQSVMRDAEKAALAGDVAAGNKLLMAAAERDKSPEMAFLIANLLYRADPTNSYRLHKLAYDALPDEPNTQLEMAMEMHRRGEYAPAESLYSGYLSKTPDERMNAMRADCLVRLGNLAEAVKAWNLCGHAKNHESIDSSIFEIYRALSPIQRRSALLERIRAGEDGAFEDVIVLDGHYDDDWWNTDVNKAALAADAKLAGEKLGADSARYKAIQCYADLALKSDLSAASAREVLQKAKLVAGAAGELPANSKLARALVELVLRSGAESRDSLWQRFEKELLARAKSEKGDPEALHLLCVLALETQKAKAIEHARYGWERYQDVRFATIFLAEALAKKELAPDNADLKAALAKAPEDNVLNLYRLRAVVAAGKEPDNETLVACIKAEYRHLSTGMAIPDSFTLKNFFGALEDRLKAGK